MAYCRCSPTPSEVSLASHPQTSSEETDTPYIKIEIADTDQVASFFYKPSASFAKRHEKNLRFMRRVFTAGSPRCLDIQNLISCGNTTNGEPYVAIEKYEFTLQDVIDESPCSFINASHYIKIFESVCKGVDFYHFVGVSLGGKIKAKDILINGELRRWSATISPAIALEELQYDKDVGHTTDDDYVAISNLIFETNKINACMPTTKVSLDTRIFESVHLEHLARTILAFTKEHPHSLDWNVIKVHLCFHTADQLLTFLYRFRGAFKNDDMAKGFDDLVLSKVGKEAGKVYSEWFYNLPESVQTAILIGGCTKFKSDVFIVAQRIRIEARPAIKGRWTKDDIKENCQMLFNKLKFNFISSVLIRIRERYLHGDEDDEESTRLVGYNAREALGFWLSNNNFLLLHMLYYGYSYRPLKISRNPFFKSFFNATEWFFIVGERVVTEMTREDVKNKKEGELKAKSPLI